jgi:hypothetical protein
VQLDNCTVASNKDANVFAVRGAVLGLTGCTVLNSLESCGLAAQDKGTCVNAKETTFKGNSLRGVAAGDHASVHLDKCTMASNKNANVFAYRGAVLGLIGCAARNSLENCGLAAQGKGTRVDAKETTFQQNFLPGVAVCDHASVQLEECTMASNKDANVFALRGAVLDLIGCTVFGSLENCGLAAHGKGTRVDAKESSFQGSFVHGVGACEYASVQLDKCTLESNKDANVSAYGGAVLGLTGCTVAGSSENCGLAAQGKGTRVDAKETTFQRSFLHGVGVCDHASVQLDKCMVASNKDANVYAYGGAVLGLTGCTVVGSSENCGLAAQERGTRVDAKDTTFKGNCLAGVAACDHASVQLDKCTVASNKDANVLTFGGAVLGLTGCTVVGSFKNSGLAAKDRGTRVDAKDTKFQGNFLRGVAAGEHASVQLDKCTVASNKVTNVYACRGALLGLIGCTVVDSLGNCGLAVQDRGTRVDAKETTFRGNFHHGVFAFEYASVQLDKCTVASNKVANVYAGGGAVLGLTGCTFVDSVCTGESPLGGV